jgi:hypothetical protein
MGNVATGLDEAILFFLALPPRAPGRSLPTAGHGAIRLRESAVSPPTARAAPAQPIDDDLSIPAFLRRTESSRPEVKKAA